MNPGLASVVLNLIRPPKRGGYQFAPVYEEGESQRVIFRARRLAESSKGATGGEFEAGRERDYQTVRFQIRMVEFSHRFRDNDLLSEDLASGRKALWKVNRWHEVAGTRGLWCEVHCEETRGEDVFLSQDFDALAEASEATGLTVEEILSRLQNSTQEWLPRVEALEENDVQTSKVNW